MCKIMRLRIHKFLLCCFLFKQLQGWITCTSQFLLDWSHLRMTKYVLNVYFVFSVNWHFWIIMLFSLVTRLHFPSSEHSFLQRLTVVAKSLLNIFVIDCYCRSILCILDYNCTMKYLLQTKTKRGWIGLFN